MVLATTTNVADHGPYANPAIKAGTSSKWIFRKGGKKGILKLKNGIIYKMIEIAAKTPLLARIFVFKPLILDSVPFSKTKIKIAIKPAEAMTIHNTDCNAKSRGDLCCD